MLSTESNANSFNPIVQTADGLTPKDPLNFTLSNAGLGKGADRNIAEGINRWAKGSSSRTKRFGDINNNNLTGSNRADQIWGNSGDDVIKGGNGSDKLYGESGNDTLLGESGNDMLVGDSGNDYLDGGSGKDMFTGGSGNDRFVITPATRRPYMSNADIITDFTDGQDRLKLDGGLRWDNLSITQAPGRSSKDTVIRNKSTGDHLMVLRNVKSSTINLADFSDLPAPSTPAPAPASSPAPRPTPSPSPIPAPSPSPRPVPSAGSLGFSTASYSIGEGSDKATITVNRVGGSAGQVKVNYATIAGGTAQAGADYTTSSGTLTFSSGQTSKTFTVPIINDTRTEGSETIRLALNNPAGGALGTQTTATVTITDNDAATPPPPVGGGSTGSASPASITGGTVKFSPGESETAIAAKGAARIKIGTQTIYIGAQQVTSINQNPIIASFDSANPANNWVKTNYEATGADGRGYGLFWDGSNLYGVFSVDGTQGTPGQDFRRVAGSATQSWLRSYGQGGGAKIAVIAKIDPRTGEMSNAAHLSSRLSSGNSNSLAITGLSVGANGNLVVKANSWFAPRRADGTAMTQTASGSSPFAYTVEMSRDLKTVVNTSAVGWS